jgi:hypothetical protein
MPDAVEVLLFSLAQVPDLGLVKQCVENRPMEAVERCPGQLTATNPVHRRRISGAPRVGQLRPIHLDAFGLAELPAFAVSIRQL